MIGPFSSYVTMLLRCDWSVKQILWAFVALPSARAEVVQDPQQFALTSSRLVARFPCVVGILVGVADDVEGGLCHNFSNGGGNCSSRRTVNHFGMCSDAARRNQLMLSSTISVVPRSSG